MKKKCEKKIWPFDNGGFLTGRQLFEILLLKRKDLLKEELLREGDDELTVKTLSDLYRSFLSESVLGLSDAEKEFLVKTSGEEGKGEGCLKAVLDGTDWVIRTGSFCELSENGGTEISVNGKLFKKAAFLCSKTPGEEERTVRILTIEETGRDLTVAEPFVSSVNFEARRPPAGEWGIRIKGRKGRKNDKRFL